MPSLIDRVDRLDRTPATRSAAAQASANERTSLASDVPKDDGQLGKQDFLQLLIAQLRNQDPLKPMEDREFIAQLAQFSSLEALQGLGTKIDTMLKTSELDQAARLVGRSIRAITADGTLVEGVVSEMQIVSGTAQLKVNDQTILLENVLAVLS